jgi:uncharacterized protein YdeI (BOF family)
MKKLIPIYALVVLLAIIFNAGCSKPIENFGKEIALGATTKIKDILSDKKKYNQQTVKVQGKIINQCPSGHWLDLADDTGEIHVSLVPAGSTIPPKLGVKATVEGKVIDQGYVLEIAGEGVKFE